MSLPVSIELLRKAPLFAQLPPVLLREVAASTTLVSRRRGARIFEEGSVADSCYLLTSGRAKITMTGANGVEITIAILQPFALVGEISLIDTLPRSAGFAAVDECRLLQIPRRAFLALRRNREFDSLLMVHVATTLRRATEQLRAIYTFDSVERVAWCVAQMAVSKGRPNKREISISPKPSHRELAEMTGSSRETVSRALLRLRKMRWLRWDRSGFHMDVKAAARYAGRLNPLDLPEEEVVTGLRAV